MDEKAALDALTALAQESRLAAFRDLVRAGPEGLVAGAVAELQASRQNTMSSHLAVLSRSGLVSTEREGRAVRYRAELGTMRGLLSFLMEDCCGGRPELCGPVLADALATREGNQTMADDETTYNILFLCTGNSARSILGEAIVNRDWRGKFRAYSAGSQPKGEVNPHALKLLKALNFETEGLRSKDWAEFAEPGAPKMDFVFTVCDNAAAEVCPIWPGQPMSAHWGLPDPAEATGTEAEIALAFDDTYRMLDRRISIFANLPLTALDKVKLQKQLDTIGSVGTTTVGA